MFEARGEWPGPKGCLEKIRRQIFSDRTNTFGPGLQNRGVDELEWAGLINFNPLTSTTEFVNTAKVKIWRLDDYFLVFADP